MSNSNLPVKFIDILKNEIPPNMLNTVINNLQNEIASNPKLAKSLKKIEETFMAKKIEKFTEEKSKSKPLPEIKPVIAPITTDDLLKLPPIKEKPKVKFTSIYTPDDKFEKPKPPVPYVGQPVPREKIFKTIDPEFLVETETDPPFGSGIGYNLAGPVILTTRPKTGSFDRNTNYEPEGPKKEKSENEKEAQLQKREELVKREEKLLQRERDLNKKEEDIIKRQKQGSGSGSGSGKNDADLGIPIFTGSAVKTNLFNNKNSNNNNNNNNNNNSSKSRSNGNKNDYVTSEKQADEYKLQVLEEELVKKEIELDEKQDKLNEKTSGKSKTSGDKMGDKNGKNGKTGNKKSKKGGKNGDKKGGKKGGKQIFNGKSLPAELPTKDSLPDIDTLEYDQKKDQDSKKSFMDSISSILEQPITSVNTLTVGKVLQNISGVTGLFPPVIYNLSMQELVNYALKAFGDFFIDISKNFSNLSIAKIIELLVKDNRILYIGLGLFVISTILYIFNNFIRIPLSLSGLLGISGDKRVFVNNY